MAIQTINNGDTGLAARTKINENFAESYVKIQDTAGTTSVDTESATYPNQVIITAPTATTGLILQAFSGTTSVFQVDGNGDIWNNGGNIFHASGTDSIFIGTKSALSSYNPTAAFKNVVIGVNAGSSITIGDFSTIVGYDAGKSITDGRGNSLFGNSSGAFITGIYNTCMGVSSGYGLAAHDYNTCIGYASGLGNKGNRNIFLGSYSGAKQATVSNLLLINNYFFANAAEELTNSIVVGLMAATPATQYLRANGKFCVNAAPLTNQVAGDALLEGGSLILKEITTPTADADYGKIYTKSDNKIYFQDGGGTEHEIAFV